MAMSIWQGDTLQGLSCYETARIACGIIASNIWDGYFTNEVGGLRLELKQYGFLSKGEYYFHVPGLFRGSHHDELNS